MAIVIGCGGDEDPAGAGTTGDGGEEAAAVEAGCGDLNDLLTQVPDASIGDSGASTGACLSCVNVKCQAILTDCNKDCVCVDGLGKALDCYQRNAAEPTLCLAPLLVLPQSVRDLGFRILGCLQQQCNDECAADEIGDGGPGDPVDASDASDASDAD